jgi:hypothetical protein
MVFADLFLGICRGNDNPLASHDNDIADDIADDDCCCCTTWLALSELPTSEPSGAETPTLGPYYSSENRMTLVLVR